jgi:hypothetical protein
LGPFLVSHKTEAGKLSESKLELKSVHTGVTAAESSASRAPSRFL